MLHVVGNGSKPHDPMTLELYPEGNSSFSLYEDDGVTRQHELGYFSSVDITMCDRRSLRPPHALCRFGSRCVVVARSASSNFSTHGKPDVVVKVSAPAGKGFVGQLKERSWVLNVHSKAAPVRSLPTVPLAVRC